MTVTASRQAGICAAVLVALGLFVLPFLRVGGVSFFKMESSDIADKPFARIATFTRAFIAVYLGITLACTVAYDVTAMGHFDAIVHAFTTVATAGFGNYDNSFAAFDSLPLLWVSTFFMTLCSLPFSILIVLLERGRLVFDGPSETLRERPDLLHGAYLAN